MEGVDLLHVEQWTPLTAFGFDNPFFAINSETIIYTWIAIALIIVSIIVVRVLLARHNKTTYFLATQFVQSFMDMTTQALGHFSFIHFCFITALFIFIVVANCMPLVPYLEEPTADLNTTLALGIIGFMYIQIYAIKYHGIVGYIKEYFQPFFLMLPLHVVGKLSTIVSISFRLFGNIFGGATISKLYLGAIKGSLIRETVGIVLGINFIFPLFFGLLEGLLQAFVFTMLTLTYLSIALHDEDESEERVP